MKRIREGEGRFPRTSYVSWKHRWKRLAIGGLRIKDGWYGTNEDEGWKTEMMGYGMMGLDERRWRKERRRTCCVCELATTNAARAFPAHSLACDASKSSIQAYTQIYQTLLLHPHHLLPLLLNTIPCFLHGHTREARWTPFIYCHRQMRRGM